VQYFDAPDPARVLRIACWSFFGSLAVIIALLALISPNEPPPPETTTTTTTDSRPVADLASEQRITLTDGRTVLCLSFPAPANQIVCDWAGARRPS
jgi:hypothetical protein